MHLIEGNNDDQNNEVADDNNSPFRSGGLKAKRIVETSSDDSHDFTHPLIKYMTTPVDSDTAKNSTSEKKTKQEGHVGQS